MDEEAAVLTQAITSIKFIVKEDPASYEKALTYLFELYNLLLNITLLYSNLYQSIDYVDI